MPCRRPHRKSKLGCRRCKIRRMKCDEIHPLCGNCTRMGLVCDYAELQRTATRPLPPIQIAPLRMPIRTRDQSSLAIPSLVGESTTDSSATSTALSSPKLGPVKSSTPRRAEDGLGLLRLDSPLPFAASNPGNRLLELRLMHHYTARASTASLQKPDPRTADLAPWFARLAIEKPSLTDAVLCFSAFNLRYIDPDDKTLSRASHFYMARAIRAHAEELRRGVSTENGEILFAGAAIIALNSITSNGFTTADEQDGNPIHWFQPWQGVKLVHRATLSYVRDQRIKNGLQYERETWDQLGHHREDEENENLAFSFLLDDIDKERVDQETLEAYETSICWLSRVYQSPHVAYVFKFTAAVSPRFVTLLAERDARALTIVGYFFMVLNTQEKFWWMPCSVEKEFAALVRLLPAEWRPRMAWAEKVFQEASSKKQTPELDIPGEDKNAPLTEETI